MSISPKKPLVSVIMPTYNRAHVIERALASVLEQSYQNFELHIVDDGSDDHTQELLSRHQGADKRITYLKLPRSGVCRARNLGLAQARGELVAYLDSDNRWHPDYLGLMVEQFKKSKHRCGYAAHNHIDRINGKHELWNDPYCRDVLLKRNIIDLNIFMHEKHLFDELGGFDENLTRLVDWDLVLRYTENHDPFFLNLALADYFCDAGLNQISNTMSFLENYRKITTKYSPVSPNRECLLDGYPNRKGIDEIVEKVVQSGSSKIAVYGAGAFAELLISLLRQVSLEPLLLVDSNPDKWGQLVHGFPCSRPEKVVDSGCEAILIASQEYKKEIIKSLLDLHRKTFVPCPLIIHA